MYYRHAQSKLKYEGNVFETKFGNSFIVTKYVNRGEIHIKFLDTGYETTTDRANIARGSIRDRLTPSAFGVGIIGAEASRVNGILEREAILWRSMLQRCYSEKSQARRQTYKDCTVSDNFKYYPYFKDWCNNQIGFSSFDTNGNPFELDKDILVKGNKVYSEDTCSFIPPEINKLLIKCNASRGDTPIGVHYSKTKKNFQVGCHINGKLIHLSYYTCPKLAFLAYKEAKETNIKDVANKWKDKIDPRVYEALINWKVEIDD